MILKKTISIILAMIIMMFCGCSVGYADCQDSYYEFNDELKDYTKELCDEYEVPYSLVIAIMYHESRFISTVGDKYVGLMQVGTTKDVTTFLKNQNEEAFGGNFDLYDPKTNILAGITILQKDIKSSDTIEEAMCKYACGEANCAKRMKNNRGYCKPSREIIELMHEYDDIFRYDFLKKTLEEKKTEYYDLLRECDKCSDDLKEFYKISINHSFNMIQFLNCEIEKYEMEHHYE